MKNRRAFTLIELLVVIAILAVLSVSAILVLKPADLIKQSRDSVRLSDLTNLNKSLSLAQIQGITNLGQTNVVYLSLADNGVDDNSNGIEDDCDDPGFNLPQLPSPWRYKCVTSANYRKSDGTGWLPVNLNSIPTGSPLPVLPVDPKQN